MTDFEAHPEIDDELLSAYLDDELPAEERASVEARLASDPRARQLLDELRAASHAVRDLPRQTVGHDLRESVLRRAEEAMLVPSRAPANAEDRSQPGGPTDPADALPRFTIGRTKRGWAWAALATAAGLMIMFWYPGERQERIRFPEVARKRGEAPDAVASASRQAPAELRRWRDSPASESAPDDDDQSSLAESEAAPRSGGYSPAPSSVTLDFATPAAPEPGQSSRGAVDESAVPSGELAGAPTGAPRQPTDGKQGRYARGEGLSSDAPALAVDTSGSEPAQTSPESDETSIGIAAASQPVRDELESFAPAEDDFLVVQVVVNDKAIESGSFDRLLAKHGIALEEQRSAEGRSSVSGGEAVQAGTRFGQELDRFAARQPEVQEAVLVVAPRETIESCLAELKQDEANYLGLAVDDAAAVAATTGVKLELADGSPDKGLAEELGRRFSRGKTPAESNRQAYRFYVGDFFFSGGQQSETGGGGFGGTSGAAPPEQAAGRRAAQNQSSLESLAQGRARRLVGRELRDKSLAAQAETSASITSESRSVSRQLQLGKLRQELKDGADLSAEPLYVLFVLLPEPTPPDGAPSPAAENRPE